MPQKIPNVIFKIFALLVVVWSVYYVISMTDCNGAIKYFTSQKGYAIESDYSESEMYANGLPESYNGILSSQVFKNRFGKNVVVRVDPYIRVFGSGSHPVLRPRSIRCYDPRFADTSLWGFMQITPGMAVDEVVRLVGVPSRTEEKSGVAYSIWEIEDKRFQIIWESGQYEDVKLGLDRRYEFVGGRGVTYVDENGIRQQLTPLPIQPYITLAVGFVTALIILLRLKKKGILCKKKQSTE